MTEYLTLDTDFSAYMIFPRFLLDCELTETAKLLYVVLLDRARLSISNGWRDEYGHVYVYFPIVDLAKVMHKGEVTIKNCLASLEEHNLIVRKRQGVGLPNRIYVRIISGRADAGEADAGRSVNGKSGSGKASDGFPAGRQTVLLTDRLLSP